eukprot:GFYU01008869.1.p1 GENE.GFYU01008869.1~~GFYU01008869.1.p1  ORF type:complete len:442 (-),score=79.07 GFYU01008869.1:27-1352(-)
MSTSKSSSLRSFFGGLTNRRKSQTQDQARSTSVEEVHEIKQADSKSDTGSDDEYEGGESSGLVINTQLGGDGEVRKVKVLNEFAPLGGPLKAVKAQKWVNVLLADIIVILSTDSESGEVINMYKKFLSGVSLLRMSDVNRVHDDPKSRVAFVLNMANCLALHAQMQCEQFRGCSTYENKVDRASRIAYDIGGHMFSLEDLHNTLRARPFLGRKKKSSALGISLRSLSTSTPGSSGSVSLSIEEEPSSPPESFSSLKSPAADFPIQSPGLGVLTRPGMADNRTHFALVLGTISSPRLRLYRAETLDDQLDEATREYLDKTVEASAKKNAVLLPRVLKWYAHEFGTNDVEVLMWVRDHMSDPTAITNLNELIGGNKPFTVKYRKHDFNWGLQVASHAFDLKGFSTLLTTDIDSESMISMMNLVFTQKTSVRKHSARFPFVDKV